MDNKKEVLEKYGFEPEKWEEKKGKYLETAYPKHKKRFRLITEKYNNSIEEAYYWIFSHLSEFLSFTEIIKIVDTFAASENSAFFGVSQQRIGIQQDKVSQFLATIGKMVKELFQIVRELRIIDERLGYYRDSWGIDEDDEPTNKGPQESAEVALKGIWIDMVQGGAKNPGSVYGMAREVQFLSLPDLFFSTHPKTEKDIDDVVDNQRSGFNQSVRKVLKRQLAQYMQWKKETYKELTNRKKFTIKYLRQHYDVINMYMGWVKPYLRNVQRLSMSEKNMDDPQMIAAFENSLIEIEILAKKPEGKAFACVLINFLYRTRPAMSYQQEGYNRGPIHVGRLDINIRAYGWSQEDIDNYQKVQDELDLEMMKGLSGGVKAAMEALGDDLKKYLKEAGEKFKEDEDNSPKKEEKKPDSWTKFKAEFFNIQPKEKEINKNEDDSKPSDAEKAKAAGAAQFGAFMVFKNFKKAHGLLMW